MSRIVHLENGSAIHADIVTSFDKAVRAKDNVAKGEGSTDFWNFVEADMYMDLGSFYKTEYLDECFNTLADQWTAIDKEYEALFGVAK